MIAFIGRRLVLSITTLFVVSLLVFGATELLPGDVATALLGREATPQSVERLREELGLNRPAIERYGEWIGGALRGDLGESIARNQPIDELIASRLRNTLLLSGAAALLGIPLALACGILAGLMRDRLPDLAVSTVALVGMSLPEFVLGSLLIMLFAISWPLFPAVTTVPPTAPVGELLSSLILPAATLAIVMVAYITRMVRTSLIDAMTSDYVQMATLRGLSRARVVLRHALPNALLPTINATALTVAWLVSGVVVVETVFNFPGLGRLMVSAVHERDLPLVQAIGLLGAATYIGVNLLADLLSLLLNPRLRTMGGG